MVIDTMIGAEDEVGEEEEEEEAQADVTTMIIELDRITDR